MVQRRNLRRLFVAKCSRNPSRWQPDAHEVVGLGRVLMVDPGTLTRLMVDLGTFGRWLEAVAQLQASDSCSAETELIPINDAIGALRSRLRDREKQGLL